MGLDGVEIIMAVEDAFGVEIKDTDALSMVTPRDVIEFVVSRVPITEDEACLSQRAFHVLRASVLEMTPNDRRAITPITPLSHLFLLIQPREVSRRVAKALDLPTLPPLDGLSTVGDLVQWLATRSAARLKRGQAWTRQEIASIVRRIVVDQLALEDENYGEDKRFVKDLGVS
jgi:acyl carrier protein